jgi:predicted metal-dependent hydrolase
MDYKLIRSIRKSITITVSLQGEVLVRAPHDTAKKTIDTFILSKKSWIEQAQSRLKNRQMTNMDKPMEEEEINENKKKAKEYITKRAEYFALRMGVRYKSIKINSAKTRWGSCNKSGMINFSYRLILAPPALVDYVIIHELAHLKELNHSAKFWKVVHEELPDYKEKQKALSLWNKGEL